MKKLTLIIALSVLALSAAIAQEKEQKKHEKVYYKPASAQLGTLNITATDAVATPVVNKVKVKLVSTGTDFILFKPEDCSMKTAGGEFKYTERKMLLRGQDDGSRVLDIKGDHRDNSYSLVLSGLYKISVDGPFVETPDFSLPASTNSFTTGPFKVTMLKVKKETAETAVRFKVEYTGDKGAVLNYSRISVKMPDGKEYACHEPSKTEYLQKGESDNFTVTFSNKDIPTKVAGDMQFVEMKIEWKDTFREVTPEKLPSQTLNIEMDLGKTAAKN